MMNTFRIFIQPWMVLFISLLLPACSDPSPAPKTPATESVPAAVSQDSQAFHVEEVPAHIQKRIQVEEVIERLTPRSVTAPGNVALDLAQVAKVSSRIPGQIDRIMVQLGHRVKKGQPLAAVESLRLDELVQEYLVAKSKLDVATSNFERTTQLQAENIISQRRYLEDRGHQLEARAVYQHVREKLLNMGLTKEDLHQLEHGSHVEGHKYLLRAPLDGTVVDQRVVLGQGIAAGEELFEIVDTSRVWVFANLPIEQARRFKEGDQGQVVPRGGKPILANLTYLAPVADETTRTIRVRFDVDNAEGHLKPNEYVDVRLLDEQQPVLSIPLSAITMLEGARGAFVKHGTGFRFVRVDIGQEQGGFVEVKSGLKAGEFVATKGVFDLKNAAMKSAIQQDH